MAFTLTRITNAATIAGVCAIVAVAVDRTATIPVPRSPAATERAAGAERIGGVARAAIARADHTLLLVLMDGCGYCAASMPLYREMATRRADAGPGGVRLVAVVLQQPDAAAAAAYIRSHGLTVDETVAVAPEEQAELGVEHTPTLIYADRTGAVEHKWRGLLDAPEAQRLLDAIFPAAGAVRRPL